MAFDTRFALYRPDGSNTILPQSRQLLKQNATIGSALDQVKSEMWSALNPSTLVRSDDPRLAATPAAEIMPRLDDVETKAQQALDLAQSTTAPTDDQVAALAVSSSGSDTYEALAGGFVVTDRAAHVYNVKSEQFTGTNLSDRVTSAAAWLATEFGGVGQGKLQISEHDTLTKPLVIDVNQVGLDCNGFTIDASAITTDDAIQLTSTATTVVPVNQLGLRNFQLIGPGMSASTNGILCRYDGTGNAANVRDWAIENFVINGFANGIAFGKNAYLLKFINGQIYNCDNAVYVQPGTNGSETNTNYGENLSFYGVCFGSNNTEISMQGVGLTDINCFGCSFDLLKVDQVLADVAAGTLNIYGSHIELAGTQTKPIFHTHEDTTAAIFVSGNRVQWNPTTSKMGYLVQTDGAGVGGGVTFSGVQLRNIQTATGFLADCVGPGNFKTTDVKVFNGVGGSGYLMSSVAKSKMDNCLLDPTFAQATHVDFSITSGAGQTSRVNSTAIGITNSGGKMTVTHKTTGSGQVSIYVPVTRPGGYYSTWFTLDSTTCTGSLRFNERFIAARGVDSYGNPTGVVLGHKPSEKWWDVTTLPGTTVAWNTMYSDWNRQAPDWATHYVVDIPVSNLSAGNLVFSGFGVTVL